MKHKVVLSCLLATVCLLAFRFDAGASILIRFNNDGYPYTQDYSGKVGGITYTYKAGIYSLTVQNYGVVEGFCVEGQGGSFSDSPYNLVPLTGDKYIKAAWLANQFVTGGLNDDYIIYYGGTVARNTLAAAVQTAIWEFILDTDSSTTAITGTTYNTAGYSSFAQELFTIANTDGVGFNANGWRLAQSSLYQDLLVPVPIPAAAWLLGSGLIGLAVIRRRMKK